MLAKELVWRKINKDNNPIYMVNESSTDYSHSLSEWNVQVCRNTIYFLIGQSYLHRSNIMPENPLKKFTYQYFILELYIQVEFSICSHIILCFDYKLNLFVHKFLMYGCPWKKNPISLIEISKLYIALNRLYFNALWKTRNAIE